MVESVTLRIQLENSFISSSRVTEYVQLLNQERKRYLHPAPCLQTESVSQSQTESRRAYHSLFRGVESGMKLSVSSALEFS